LPVEITRRSPPAPRQHGCECSRTSRICARARAYLNAHPQLPFTALPVSVAKCPAALSQTYCFPTEPESCPHGLQCMYDAYYRRYRCCRSPLLAPVGSMPASPPSLQPNLVIVEHGGGRVCARVFQDGRSSITRATTASRLAVPTRSLTRDQPGGTNVCRVSEANATK
jgi:hypothetical protein